MNRFRASLLVTISLNGACHYATTSNDFQPMTQGTPGATELTSQSRPAVRFPERFELLQSGEDPVGFEIAPEPDGDTPKHVVKVGLSGR